MKGFRLPGFGCGVPVLLLCACQAGPAPLFPAIEPALVWPSPPEAPRIRLIGSLSSSDDLGVPLSALEVLAGAVRGPRPAITFSAPNGLAWHRAGRLGVADGGTGAVHILDLEQRTHLVLLCALQQVPEAPVGAAWVGDSLYISDARQRCLAELDGQGRVLRSFGREELVRPVGIVDLPQRQMICVVDAGAHCLRFYDRDGRQVRQMGERGAGPGQFNFPTHIAQDSAGRLAVADTGNFRVQLLDLDGTWLANVGRKGDGAGDLALPKGVGFDSDGHLYVVDAQFENFQIFDQQGQLLLAVGHEGSALGQFSLPAGLAIDDRDRIWVADAGNQRVQVFQYLRSGDGPT